MKQENSVAKLGISAVYGGGGKSMRMTASGRQVSLTAVGQQVTEGEPSACLSLFNRPFTISVRVQLRLAH